jgi:hypothetical protein
MTKNELHRFVCFGQYNKSMEVPAHSMEGAVEYGTVSQD